MKEEFNLSERRILRDYNCFCKGDLGFKNICYECNLPIVRFIDENIRDDGTIFLGNIGVRNLFLKLNETFDKIKTEEKSQILKELVQIIPKVGKIKKDKLKKELEKIAGDKLK